MAKNKKEKEYIVFIYNTWTGGWKDRLMTKKEVEDYIEANGVSDVKIFKVAHEVKFKKIFEMEA